MTPDPLLLGHIPTLLLAAVEEGKDAAVLVVVEAPEGHPLGSRLLVLPDAELGSLGDSAADAEGIRLARTALKGDGHASTLSLPTEKGGEIRAFLELHHPSPELVIVGAGHVAQPLATMGALQGLRVKVLDDRPEFATRERFPEASDLMQVDFSDPFVGVPLHPWSHIVLVTRGHKYDYECLRRILTTDRLPAYIGMIGSRRRVRATYDALLREGLPKEKLEAVRAPIGLDIGGETPAEIAVSIMAEIIHLTGGGTGRPLSEMEQILTRFHPEPPAGEED
jgi:xanthine dehydrogenase accessory factor